MKLIMSIVMLLGFCLGCSVESPVEPATEVPARPYEAQTVRSNIVAALPSGWSEVSPSWQQDSYTREYFTNAQTEAFLLLGPQSNYIDWTDRMGDSHREHLARECLYIWIVPGNFKPLFPRSRESWEPEQLYSSRNLRAYGYISHHIADTNRFNMILKNARMISSGDVRISWLSWKRDIGASLKE